MTVTNGYTTEAELLRYMLPSGYSADTIDNNEIDAAINGASREIDGYCNTRFWKDGTVVARTFMPDSLTVLELGDDPFCPGIADTAGLIIRTDASGDGVFETTWASTDFQLLPQNAAYAYPEARPWTTVRAVGTRTFPWLVNTWLTRLDRVQITALWGWPAVPDAVHQACLILASRLYKRRDSIQGIAADVGMYLGSKQDPDVTRLLQPYRRVPILVG